MKILITEAQHRMINELMWKEPAFVHFEKSRIPLTKKVYNILYGKHRIKVFHITDIDNIPNILNLIGKKHTLSTFKYMDRSYLSYKRGIQTKGGIILYLEGDLVLHSLEDIMSMPDENGLRWVDDEKIFNKELMKEWINIMYDFWREYSYKEKYKRTELVKKYFKIVESFVDINKDLIIKKLISKESNNYWDEILVNNIEIKDILLHDRERDPKYSHALWVKKYDSENLSQHHLNDIENYENRRDKIVKKLEGYVSGEIYGEDKDVFEFVSERGGFMNFDDYKSNINKNVFNYSM